AGGYREEECDHDDRFRSRSRADAAHPAGKSNRARCKRAIPSDYDDDVCRADGDASNRAGKGCGRGSTTSAWRRGGGGTCVLFAADAMNRSVGLKILNVSDVLSVNPYDAIVCVCDSNPPHLASWASAKKNTRDENRTHFIRMLWRHCAVKYLGSANCPNVAR